ncbi:MAG: sporulation protein YqfC [Epulopiscium sp.]|nr:sporulation protein YqfC [Candidatus Epulonipiscium sp.]
MMRKKEEKQAKKKMTDWFEFPKEVIMDLPVISLIGREELFLENYKGMIEYNDEQMRISTTCGILKVVGRNLHLKVMTTENIIITGTILSIEYIN